MYRSTDAGKTWSSIGLRDTGQISTIRVDPSNPDLVYVAALGNPFVPNKDRVESINRQTAGSTWKNVLFVSESAGAADFEIQPGNSKVLFACMWHGQRMPWTIISGAQEGGNLQIDRRRRALVETRGRPLPHDDLFGRANVAISNAQPNRIYALIEAKPGSGTVAVGRCGRQLDAG